MALFTDSDIVTLNDLLQFEAGLVQVASTHNINITTKVTLSVDSISDRLMLWLLKAGASDPQWMSRRLLGLSTVVVTPTLHRWLCFETLSRFYAEAYDVQLNTRFQAKWTEYQTESSTAADMVFMSGIGIVYNALPQPALPEVTLQAGSVPAQSLFIQTAWTDTLGNESALSPINGVILSDPSNVTVFNTSAAPSAAVGWNVYVSSSEDGLTRQNTTPISVGANWMLQSSGVINGAEPLNGQQPNYYIDLSRRIQRG